MGDPFTTTRETTVTIKESTKHDAAWLVFRGRPAEIIEDIVETFGLGSAGVTGLSLCDVVILGKKAFQSGGLVAVELGGTPVPPASEAAGAPAAGGPPWHTPEEEKAAAEAAQKQAEPVDPKVEHLAKIEGFTDVDALKLYWADNQAAFTDAELMAAYKAKGKALKAATQ